MIFFVLCSNIEILVKGHMCNAQYRHFYANHSHIFSFLEIFFLSIFGNFLFSIFYLGYLVDFLVAWLIFCCFKGVTRKNKF